MATGRETEAGREAEITCGHRVALIPVSGATLSDPSLDEGIALRAAAWWRLVWAAEAGTGCIMQRPAPAVWLQRHSQGCLQGSCDSSMALSCCCHGLHSAGCRELIPSHQDTMQPLSQGQTSNRTARRPPGLPTVPPDPCESHCWCPAHSVLEESLKHWGKC